MIQQYWSIKDDISSENVDLLAGTHVIIQNITNRNPSGKSTKEGEEQKNANWEQNLQCTGQEYTKILKKWFQNIIDAKNKKNLQPKEDMISPEKHQEDHTTY